ncbi:MAG: IS4 family transposase [Deltaproteobacteria bacterium]|nr:IS4 family transposase [Deltaproteobacteria bacterium]
MAHCNTIFHQMLKLIPRHHFAKLEAEHGTGRKARSFTRWSQLVHLLSMQLTARVSLRDGVSSLKARVKSLYHLGVKPVPRSTFADANNQRPASFYEALFGLMYRRCQPLTPKHKFKFKNKLFSLDATVVSLCLSLYPWASFRRTKGGIKLHTLLDHGGYLPAFVAVSPAREPDIKKARSLSLPKGSIVVEDLGYTDYAWYAQLTAQKIFFVTRQKRNARYEVMEHHKVNKSQGLLSDQTIRLTGAKSQQCHIPLRRIAYRDAATGRRYVFLTNHFKLAAKTIADIYKERWQIEIFFRFIKQNLKIKAFIGNSENAVLTQIYAALIVYLLLCYLKFMCNLSITLQNCIRILQLNLFRTCTVQELFEPPEMIPDNMCHPKQLTLALA